MGSRQGRRRVGMSRLPPIGFPAKPESIFQLSGKRIGGSQPSPGRQFIPTVEIPRPPAVLHKRRNTSSFRDDAAGGEPGSHIPEAGGHGVRAASPGSSPAAASGMTSG